MSDALLDNDWAVVVLQERTESRPNRAEVTELATGDTFTVDGSSDVPTTNGGTWALGDGRLLHATIGPGGAYCMAAVDLATRESTLGWCAPKRHGFNGAQIAPGGTSLMSFDAGRPSCRTLMEIDGTEATPFDGVDQCVAWDGLLTDDGAVWSTISDERRIEKAHFYATTGGAQSDLGPGTAGSLVWCSGAAYFTRDPQTEADPAALMRWSPTDGLAVVYESQSGAPSSPSRAAAGTTSRSPQSPKRATSRSRPRSPEAGSLPVARAPTEVHNPGCRPRSGSHGPWCRTAPIRCASGSAAKRGRPPGCPEGSPD